jgi:hypothetical protein
VGEDAVFKQIRYEKDGLVLIPKSDNNRHQIWYVSDQGIIEAPSNVVALSIYLTLG